MGNYSTTQYKALFEKFDTCKPVEPFKKQLTVVS
jgi:hypothetical protein